jgi:autotransporter-associated beta strand protein
VSAGTLQLGNGGASGNAVGSIVNNGTVIFKRSDDFTFNGAISGSGGFVQDGFILRFANAQTYAGPTSVSAGAYLVMPSGVDQGIAATSVLNVASGGTFDFSSRALTIAGLDGGGTVYSYNTAAGSLTLDVASGQTHDFSGALGGPFPNFALTKSGLGTQIISGADTHTGPTSVNGGTLVVNGTISGSTTTVNNGGTLAGTGTTGAVNVLSGGTIAPGNSPGLLTTGALSLNSGGTLSMEINGTSAYDQLAVNGTVTLGDGTLTLSGSYLTTPAVTGDLFFLILNDGTDAISGTFAGIADGGHVFAGNGQDFIVTYFADSGSSAFTGGNDVALMAVPEPGSAVFLLGGLGALGALRRRRR